VTARVELSCSSANHGIFVGTTILRILMYAQERDVSLCLCYTKKTSSRRDVVSARLDRSFKHCFLYGPAAIERLSLSLHTLEINQIHTPGRCTILGENIHMCGV
jgi:hypothetical protein